MHQITLFEVFNEPELLCDDSKEPTVSEITVSSHTRKAKSKRENNPEELPVEIYKRLSIIPQTLLVDEHHVHVYAAKNNDGTIAAEATKQISELFHLDNQWVDLEKTEREKQRQLILIPKVDAFFAWAKTEIQKLPAQSNIRNGLQYCINQEQFLRVFLENGDVPMNNNLAERVIRPFTLGRKNWVNVNSIHGARASTILYSLVETAKANKLRVYEYLEYLLIELAEHADDTNRDFLKDLLPWSEVVQEKCHSLKKS